MRRRIQVFKWYRHDAESNSDVGVYIMNIHYQSVLRNSCIIVAKSVLYESVRLMS